MLQNEEAPASQEGVVDLEEPKKMTREDWRKKKELEEQRKLGNAPAEVDEEGKYVNEHQNKQLSHVSLNCYSIFDTDFLNELFNSCSIL